MPRDHGTSTILISQAKQELIFLNRAIARDEVFSRRNGCSQKRHVPVKTAEICAQFNIKYALPGVLRPEQQLLRAEGERADDGHGRRPDRFAGAGTAGLGLLGMAARRQLVPSRSGPRAPRRSGRKKSYPAG
jgi:hypothetical protein